jgi:hypothetical protein
VGRFVFVPPASNRIRPRFAAEAETLCCREARMYISVGPRPFRVDMTRSAEDSGQSSVERPHDPRPEGESWRGELPGSRSVG